jgi:hypothetical protein
MDFFPLLLLVHLLGGVLGVGASTFLEVFLNKSLRDGKMDPIEGGFMKTTATILRTGLFISVITGIGLILIYRFNDQVFRMYDSFLWAKFTILFVLIANGVFLQAHKFKLWITSTVATVSWYSVFVLGFLASSSGAYIPYVTLLFYYALALVIGGALLESIRRMLGVKI